MSPGWVLLCAFLGGVLLGVRNKYPGLVTRAVRRILGIFIELPAPPGPEVREPEEQLNRVSPQDEESRAAVFWAIVCVNYKPMRADGSLTFLHCQKTYGPESLDSDGMVVIETRTARVAPADDIRLLGDYDTCNDWMTMYGHLLNDAVARRKGELVEPPAPDQPPTIWERLEDEDT